MTVSCGVDFHARQQTVAWCDTSDGEIHLEKLDHQDHNQVRSFYARSGRGLIVGLEASGYSQWFEALLASLGHQSWVGETCEIRRRARSRQKNDRRDAELILDLLLKDEFPRVHRLTEESLEVLRRLRDRHRLVKMRTQASNALYAIAPERGLLAQGETALARRARAAPGAGLEPGPEPPARAVAGIDRPVDGAHQ